VGICFTTGMAAISGALCALVGGGQSIVAHRTMYGCTYSLLTRWLPRQGVKVALIDLNHIAALRAAIDATTRVVYCESPANPTLELVDIGAVRKVVDAANAGRAPADRVRIVVDNTFATTYCQRPLSLGADLVVHSLTKDISGFGTVMGGAVIASRELEPDLLMYRKDFGGVMPSYPAWHIMTYGLPTLPLRMRKQQENALCVAQYLAGNPKVAKVNYPGLPGFPQADLARRQMVDPEGCFAPGMMVYFELSGDPDQAKVRGAALMDALAENALAVTLAVSLGQLRTLVEHPASMTHSMIPAEALAAGGIAPGGVRLAVGVENSADIVHDLERAFATLS
jgi:methionine-gamma-lyase